MTCNNVYLLAQKKTIRIFNFCQEYPLHQQWNVLNDSKTLGVLLQKFIGENSFLQDKVGMMGHLANSYTVQTCDKLHTREVFFNGIKEKMLLL